MESSIAVFLKRWQACELPPTIYSVGMMIQPQEQAPMMNTCQITKTRTML